MCDKRGEITHFREMVVHRRRGTLELKERGMMVQCKCITVKIKLKMKVLLMVNQLHHLVGKRKALLPFYFNLVWVDMFTLSKYQTRIKIHTVESLSPALSKSICPHIWYNPNTAHQYLCSVSPSKGLFLSRRTTFIIFFFLHNKILDAIFPATWLVFILSISKIFLNQYKKHLLILFNSCIVFQSSCTISYLTKPILIGIRVAASFLPLQNNVAMNNSS